MPCYHPLPGWFSKERNPSGKRSVVFSVEQGFKDRRIAVPCGKCIGCRLEYARRWAIRCVHESKLWERNCFVTLTYNEKEVPENGSLRPRDFVLFMKKLRFQYGPGIRFFQCGEYGEQLERPHHHALLFNHAFPDMRELSRRNGLKLYRSAELERLWPYGFCSIGEVTFESAGYVARYAVKKINGSMADAHYSGRRKEYCTMSRRPGVGAGFLSRYRSDVYPAGTVTLRGGITMGTPRFYDDLQEKVDPTGMRVLRAQRKKALEDDVDSHGSRLYVREEVQNSRMDLLISRTFEVE